MIMGISFFMFGKFFVFCFNVIVFYCLLFQGFPFGGKLSALRVAVSRLPLGGKLSALRTDEGNNLPCPSSVAYATPSPTGEGFLKQQKKCGSRKRVTPLQDTISLRLPHQNKTFANCYVLMDKAYVKEAN